MRSDSGFQLIAASKEWKIIFDNLDHNKINSSTIKHGMDWIVNKSADAPWQNGCTERLIKSIKRCINLTIGTNVLSFPELQPVYFECANMLNERPIGCKDGSRSYFCPRLILGRSSIKVPGGQFDTSLNPRKRFRFIEGITQDFRRRWQVHYFKSLIVQQKWHVEKQNLCIGDVVLVQDKSSLRGEWKLEVCSAIPGSDGNVRDVVLRYKCQDDTNDSIGTKDTLINRSVHRLVLIVPVEER